MSSKTKQKEQKPRRGFIHCTPKHLPQEKQQEAALLAVEYNPLNLPALFVPKEHLAVSTQRMWPATGVKLTVSFPFDRTPDDVQRKIVQYMNIWSQYANVAFVLSNSQPTDVRINRARDGYWSYLGTDIQMIPPNEPTMNLEGFTMRTPDAEYMRVVVHEAGHTLGFPHEHMRSQIVNRLDRNKTIAWGARELGWDRNTVIQQILTPLSESSIRGTATADEESIMCYQLPGSITKDGRPIRGGDDLTEMDKTFVAALYPKEIGPPPPPDGDEDEDPIHKWSVEEESDTHILLRKSKIEMI